MAEALTEPITADLGESIPHMVVVKFADSKIPVFKEKRNKDYIEYGQHNDYPEYLTYLFDKSGKHGAILSGKAFYIFGKGYANGNVTINRMNESLNDVAKKAILDIETYGGFKLEVIWSRTGRICEVYHVDYNTIRIGKDGGFYYKEQWTIKALNGAPMDNNKEEAVFIPAFNPLKPYGSQIYQYNEYRPGQRFYPLPSYIGCNNYVETDIEISKFYLSSIRNGMMPSKMLQFYMADPGEDKKKQIEKQFTRKFTGSENAGKFVMVFNQGGKDKQIDVEDLSGTDLDKMFVELNKTCQQEIFSGHKVTSPMLFGIKTEGQLGGNTELQTAYTIFQNTYAQPKADAFDKEIQYLLGYSIFPGEYKLQPTDPVGVQFDVKDLTEALPVSFVYKKLGIPQEEWNTPTIGDVSGKNPNAEGGAAQKPAAAPIVPAASSAAPVNDAIKNLTGRQHQQLLRIIRQYGSGKLTELAARTLIRAGTGLSEDDINMVLGIQKPLAAAAFSEDDQESLEIYIADMFDEYGECRDDFDILRSKRAMFSSEDEMEEDEEVFKAAFVVYDITATENRILELIKKDKRITADVIATTIGQTKTFVESKIDSLMKRGYLESTVETIGPDQIIEHMVPEGLDIAAPPPTAAINPTLVFVKYSYEVKPGIGPAIIKTTRPFCKKMIQLNRLYSRADIEKISMRLGYSVFDRKGGWWGKKPECRHRWVSHIVVKKGGES